MAAPDKAVTVKVLPPPQEAAWLGLLKAHAELTHALHAALSSRHGLTLGAYELLACLAQAEESHLRISQLAEKSQLSLSRVSRVVDELERRGLVARTSCPGDSRVVHAMITDVGRVLLDEAQETFFATIEERFLGRLSCDEVALLGDVFGRLVSAGPPPERLRSAT